MLDYDKHVTDSEAGGGDETKVRVDTKAGHLDVRLSILTIESDIPRGRVAKKNEF